MSWLSHGLEQIGISKSAQKAGTGLLGTVLAPATGGLSLLASGAMVKGAGGPGPASPTSATFTYTPSSGLTATTGTDVPWYKNPLVIGGGALAVVVLLIFLLRRK